MNKTKLLNKNEVALYLGISTRTLSRWLIQKKITLKKVGTMYTYESVIKILK